MEDAVLVAFVMRRADAKPWMLENIHRLRVLLKLWAELRARAPGLTASLLFDQTLQLFALRDAAEHGWIAAQSEGLRALASAFVDYQDLERQIALAVDRGSMPPAGTPYEVLAARLGEQTVAVLRKLWSRTVKYQNEEAFPGRKDAAVRGLVDYYQEWQGGDLSVLEEDLETVHDLGADGLTVRQVRLLNQDRAEEVLDRSGSFRFRRTDR